MSRTPNHLIMLVASVALATGAMSLAAVVPAGAAAKPVKNDHDYGRMADPYASLYPARASARTTFRARTVAVSPGAGPDFEMPFRCGETWVGSTRSSHSPSKYSIDFNRSGDTGRPALASVRGVVLKVARASGYGNYVILDHGAGYSTLYAHLQSTNVVVNQVVDQGDTVGFVGSTGRVTGPHLHFEERLNGNFFAPYFHRTRFAFNRTTASQNCADRPITGDWNGDGLTDLGIVRPTSTGQVFYQLVGTASTATRFSANADQPVIGDWNGNRIDQLAVRRVKSTSFLLRGEDGVTSAANLGGYARDLPVAGRWIAGAKAGLGLYDYARRVFTVRLPNLTKHSTAFGAARTQPVTGDWNGDSITDFGSFDPRTATWVLRTTVAGRVSTMTFRYGTTWDIPVTGDWNGDKVTDVGVWRPSTAVFYKRVVTGPKTSSPRVASLSVAYGSRRR